MGTSLTRDWGRGDTPQAKDPVLAFALRHPTRKSAALPRLSEEDFATVARLAPFVSIDLILRDSESAILVGYRNNEPAKGFYFVPGGVVLKNETLAEAFARILAAETGLGIPFSKSTLLGVYEHLYPAQDRHYVVLGYALALGRRPAIKLDAQHSDFRWMREPELLAAADVHDNTKAYFRP